MSIRLNGSTSGYTEIDAPAVAGSNTLVLPTGNGSSGQVLSTNGSGALSWVDRFSAAGPAFSATKASSSQAISANTWTKVQLTVEDFDTATCFDSSTNYRFTANVAGYYQINATIEFNNLSASYFVAIYRNGNRWVYAQYNNSTSTGSCGAVTALVYLNGSTDYVELYGYTNSSTSGFYESRLSGFLARPA